MDFLRQKWAYWFTSLDVIHDGVITQADVQKTLEDFPKVEGLGPKEACIAEGIIKHWWNTYILKGRDKVTEQDFVGDLERQYKEDKEKFKQTIQRGGEELIGVIDVEHDNQISIDICVNVFKAWGHHNEALLRKSFKLYEPKDGKISVQEYLNDWMIFITNDDQSVKDVALDSLKEEIKNIFKR